MMWNRVAVRRGCDLVCGWGVGCSACVWCQAGKADLRAACGAVVRLKPDLLVAAGAVEAGDGDVVEAEVDAEDGAVVDDVVHEEAADDGGAGHGEDDAVAAAEGPLVGEG